MIAPLSPFRVHILVICLAELKAKPDANHANAHPINDWTCQLGGAGYAHAANQQTVQPARAAVPSVAPWAIRFEKAK